MAEREEVNVRGIGDVRHLYNLGFTKAVPLIWEREPIYLHDISYNGKDYTLRLQRTYHRKTIRVVFFDSMRTLLEYYSSSGFYKPTVFVLVTNDGCESHPVLHEYIRCLQVNADVLPGQMGIEWKVDQTSDPKNLSFLETLSQAIITIHNEIDEMTPFYYLRFFYFENFVKDYIKNLLSSADSNRKDNVNQIILDEFFFLRSCKGAKYKCTWWSIPCSYSGSMSSTKPPIKIKGADDVNTLYASIDHDDGDIHSLCFYRQECSEIEDKISLLASRNVCIKRIIISECKGTLSFRFLSNLNEGLEYLIVVGTDVNLNDLIFSPEIISTLRVLNLRCNITEDEVPSVIGNLKNLEYLDLRENHFKRLPESFSNLCRLRYLDLRGIGLTTEEVPSVIGNLKNLENLDLNENYFKRLPESFSNLDRLRYLWLDNNAEMVFPPPIILESPAKDVIQYLKELQQKPTTKNREAKVIVVGQEGVGKSTLVKSAKKSIRLFNTTPPEKTDGIEISTLDVKSSKINVFDLAGDVEFHNTHALFFSPNCLYLAVFDLSNFTISKERRSTDQFCRLELWLQTIASQDPNCYVIIVGTKCDITSPEMLTRVRDMLSNVLNKYCSQHVATACNSLSIYECMLCNPEKVSKQDSLLRLDQLDVSSESTSSSIPHILGYHEVSGITNKNVKDLKRHIDVALTKIKQYSKTDTIPERWLRLREVILDQLSNDHQLKLQPLETLTSIREKAANEAEIYNEESFVAMLRFFHSQGDFLWYEDIPEMKDVVILDPQWLSNQLRTLISYLPEVNAICEGFLPHSDLPTIWNDMPEENRSRLMTVFRSVGLCISVKDDEDLFPCQLPIGWPDREMWTTNPGSDENQTSLLFKFSFVPASLFPDLIIGVSKRKDFFPWNVKPLYYRFNAVYITKRLHQCHLHGETLLEGSVLASTSCSDTDCSLDHRVHMEMMPHTNSLKVTIRGKQPCCQVSDIRSMIETVQSQRYPGITYKELLICPKCELKKLHNPSTFDIEVSTGGYCCKGHKVGSTDDVFAGKLKRTDVAELKREIIEAFDDHSCPKLFVVLPINLDSLSLKDRFVYSLIRDGYAVHLLCECPDQWHFLSSPGFRVGRPKEFFKKYGERVCKLLRVISALGTPFKIAAAVEPHCRAGASAASAADSLRKEIKSLLVDYLEKFPDLKPSLDAPGNDLEYLKSDDGLERSQLSKFLEVTCEGKYFSKDLICTYVDKCKEWLWLCKEHYQQYKIVKRQ